MTCSPSDWATSLMSSGSRNLTQKEGGADEPKAQEQTRNYGFKLQCYVILIPFSQMHMNVVSRLRTIE